MGWLSSRRARFFVLALAAVAAFAVLGPKIPKEQHLRFVFGDSAPRVTALHLHYAAAESPLSDEDARTALFTFDKGSAPRVVTHEPRLADGDYVLQIEIDASEGRSAVEKQVKLTSNGTTQIDLASQVPEPSPPSPSQRPSP